MKASTVDTVIQHFREGQNIFRRPSVELMVREISRLQADKLALYDSLKEMKARVEELEEALTKIASYESMRFKLSPYEYGLFEQIVGIAEHALKGGE